MHDVIIIGSGVGGYPAAIYLARKGLRVGVVEEHLVGGECTNYGCVPSKAFYQVAEALRTIKKIGSSPSIDWDKLVKWANSIVEESRRGIEYLFESYDVELITSRAVLRSDNRVVVGREVLEAKNIVLALGTDPKPLPNMGFDGEYIISNREVFTLEEKPERLLVVGGGVVGVELSYVMANLGVEVYLVEAMNRILPFLDRDIGLVIKRFLREHGVNILENTTLNKIEVMDKRVKARLSNNKELCVDKVLVAIGRKPKTENIGLENAGVMMDDHGFIVVDDKYRTTNPKIYATGDVIGQPLLAHKAILESIAAAKNIVGEKSFRLEYHLIPQTIFSGLEIAWLGYGEEELRRRNIRYKKIRIPLSYLSAIKIKDSRYSFAKILLGEDNKPYGLYIVAPNASEAISAFLPIILNKITYEEAAKTPYPHLTVSEAVREAAEYLLGEPIHVFIKK
jgi:dihydrolipoamide dehydrogenase